MVVMVTISLLCWCMSLLQVRLALMEEYSLIRIRDTFHGYLVIWLVKATKYT